MLWRARTFLNSGAFGFCPPNPLSSVLPSLPVALPSLYHVGVLLFRFSESESWKLWDSPGKNTRVGCHFLLQRIFPTQGLKPGLLLCRQTLYCLSHQGSLKVKLRELPTMSFFEFTAHQLIWLPFISQSIFGSEIETSLCFMYHILFMGFKYS